MNYVRPTGTAELLSALQEDGAAIICGGTDLLVKMRHGLVAPKTLVDVSRLEELKGIQDVDGEIHIGAAVNENEILQHPLVLERLPLLSEVLKRLAAVEIRSRGSLGGNLVNASPAADSAIPLLLYEARLYLVGPKGDRWLPVDEFFLGPGKTALGKGEFVRTIAAPDSPDGGLRFFHKVGRRRALVIAIASLGMLIGLAGERVDWVRLAAGSVGPTPLRLRSAEEALLGGELTDDCIREAVQEASRSVSPIDDVRATASYRRQVIGDLLERFLRQALSHKGR
ncbi:FAD binding domain-containing protein [Candidatus Bipolaricaulota bacterium]